VEVTNHIVKRYAVKAPTARQALIPIEHLVAHWPCEVLEAKTSITNVVQKRRRFYAGKLINRNKGK
jgi:hypothetical protein